MKTKPLNSKISRRLIAANGMKLGTPMYGSYNSNQYDNQGFTYGNQGFNNGAMQGSLTQQGKQGSLINNINTNSQASSNNDMMSKMGNSGGGGMGMTGAMSAANMGVEALADTINSTYDTTYDDDMTGQRQKVGTTALKKYAVYSGKGAALGTSVLPGWGTLIGAGVGGTYGAISGAVGAKKFNEEQEAKDNITIYDRNKLAYDNDLAELRQYRGNIDYNGRSNFFNANGGQVDDAAYNLPVDNRQQLAEDTTKVINASTHEQGDNVPITNEDGSVEAVVEGGEVIVDDMIFSRRLGYAPLVEIMVKEREALKDRLTATGNLESKNTLRRQMETANNNIKKLFDKQEADRVAIESGLAPTQQF